MFSYNDYREIIDIIKKSGKQASFLEALNKQEYVVMRHDVEFSVERAYKLALLENENDFISTYFFQLTNNSYNVLAQKNLDMIKEIYNLGHTVGLHFHLNGMKDTTEIKKAIKTEIEILNSKLPFRIQCFSFHRPPSDILRSNIKMEGFLNAYQNDFFNFVEDIQKERPEIKYLSDARHQWNYGLYPDKQTICNNKKVQILTHPYSWTEEGYDNLNNFRMLYKEKCEELLSTFDSECKHFAEIKYEL